MRLVDELCAQLVFPIKLKIPDVAIGRMGRCGPTIDTPAHRHGREETEQPLIAHGVSSFFVTPGFTPGFGHPVDALLRAMFRAIELWEFKHRLAVDHTGLDRNILETIQFIQVGFRLVLKLLDPAQRPRTATNAIFEEFHLTPLSVRPFLTESLSFSNTSWNWV